MHWMIDGAYGDLYRATMQYPQLREHNEWQIERRVARRPGRLAQAWTAMQQRTLALHTGLQAAHHRHDLFKQRTVS
jgi:hypothetical protein